VACDWCFTVSARGDHEYWKCVRKQIPSCSAPDTQSEAQTSGVGILFIPHWKLPVFSMVPPGLLHVAISSPWFSSGCTITCSESRWVLFVYRIDHNYLILILNSTFCCQIFSSSGMLSCVVWLIVTDILEDHSAFIFRVKQSKKSSCLTLKMVVALWSLRTSATIFKSTWHNSLEDII